MRVDALLLARSALRLPVNAAFGLAWRMWRRTRWVEPFDLGTITGEALVCQLPGWKRQIRQCIEPYSLARDAVIFELPSGRLGRWHALVAALGPVELPRRELQEGGRVEGFVARVVRRCIRVAHAPIVRPTIQVSEAMEAILRTPCQFVAIIVEAVADLAAGRLPGGVKNGTLPETGPERGPGRIVALGEAHERGQLQRRAHNSIARWLLSGITRNHSHALDTLPRMCGISLIRCCEQGVV